MQTESAVKIAKKILSRAKDSQEDPLLALLEWRNTPSEGFDTSPVQRLMSRRIKTCLTLDPNLLMPEVNTKIKK